MHDRSMWNGKKGTEAGKARRKKEKQRKVNGCGYGKHTRPPACLQNLNGRTVNQWRAEPAASVGRDAGCREE